MNKLPILSALALTAASTSSAIVLVSNLDNGSPANIQSVNQPFFQEFTVGAGTFDIDSISLNVLPSIFGGPTQYNLSLASVNSLGTTIGSFSGPAVSGGAQNVAYNATGVTLTPGDYRLTISGGGGASLLGTTTDLTETGLSGFAIADSYQTQNGGTTRTNEAIRFSLDGTQQVVPEPSAAGALLGLATVALVGMRRRVK